MKSKSGQSFGRTAIILGAGATRASTLRPDGSDRPLPPLDRDFFTQLQRLKNPKHQGYVNSLIEFVYNEFGSGWSL
jgi:hypothetical protein